MSNERCLRDLYAYNAWGNARVFAICREQEPAMLEREAPGTIGSIADTLRHMVGVEEVYSHMLRGHVLATDGERAAFFAHDLAWFAARGAAGRALPAAAGRR